MELIKKTYSQLIAFSLVFAAGVTAHAAPVTISPQAKAEEWILLGQGTRAAQNRMLHLAETPDSSGVMIFSPEIYSGDVTVRYEIMPMNPASICVAFLFASDSGEKGSLTFPNPAVEGADIPFGAMNAYFFAFHNLAHNRKPFVLRFPGGNLMEIDRNVAQVGRFHAVEVGRKGTMLWLEVDGERIIEIEDEEPFASGHIGFRLRGLPQHPAAALIRNVTVEAHNSK